MDARSGGPAGGGLASRTARPRRRAPRGPEPRVAARPPPRAGAPGVDGRALAAPVAVRRADGPAPRRPSLRDDSRGADGRDTGHVGHDDPPRRPDGGGRPGVPAAGPERRAGRQGPADAGRTGGRRSCAGQPAGAGAGAARPPDAGREEAAGRSAANAPGGLRLRPSGAHDRLLGMASQPDTYTHGHQEAVLRAHRWRTAENSAAYLLPLLRPGDRLLDVGCGPGTLTADLAGRVAPGPVTGVDVAATAIAEAEAHARATGVANVAFVAGDFRE